MLKSKVFEGKDLWTRIEHFRAQIGDIKSGDPLDALALVSIGAILGVSTGMFVQTLKMGLDEVYKFAPPELRAPVLGMGVITSAEPHDAAQLELALRRDVEETLLLNQESEE